MMHPRPPPPPPPPAAIPGVDMRGLLQKALDDAGNTHTLADVINLVRIGQAHIWGAGRAIAVTEFVQYPRLLALRIWLAAGVLEECEQLLPQLEAWARGQGCERIEAIGRRGWEMLAPKHGWRAASVLYRKDLEE